RTLAPPGYILQSIFSCGTAFFALVVASQPFGSDSRITLCQALATCCGGGASWEFSSYFSNSAVTFGAISAYRLLGRSGNRWVSIWCERLPDIRCMNFDPEMLAEPSIWRTYHSPPVPPSIQRFPKVSTPSGKWPHMMIEWLHRLRTTLAVKFAASV